MITTTFESRWLRHALVVAAVLAAALFILMPGYALAQGVDFDPQPEPVPGMDGLSRMINYVAWGAAIVCGICFLGVGAWLAVSVFTGQEIRAGKGLIIVIVALVIVGSAGVIVGAFM